MSFNGSEKEQAYVVVLLISCVYGTIASTTIITLIYHMNMTGYIKLILAMSWYQLLHDITMFNVSNKIGTYLIEYITNVILLIGGIGSSFMSNWMAFILFYVVVFEKSFDILKNYMYIILSTVIIWLPIVVTYSIGTLSEGLTFSIYYYVRLISIALNFILIGCIFYKNYRVRSKSTTKTQAEIAINTLCRRVMYYPILQTIGRSGYTWYEFQYGFDFRANQAEHDPERYAALMYSAIITPTVSIGYLILFLYIEPHAYKIFKKIFCGIDAPKKDSDNRSSSSRVDDSVLSTNNSSINSNNDIIISSLQERQSNIEMTRNSEGQSAYLYDNMRDSHFSWNVLRTSIAKFFTIDDDDYDNRTESEIFAAINESPALNMMPSTAPSEVHLDGRRSVTRPDISISVVVNTMHINNKSDMILNEEHVELNLERRFLSVMSFNGSTSEQAFVVILLISCSYGTIASMINIILIYHMKMTGNSYGYIKLILAMSWYQLIYDMTLFNSAIDVGNYPILYISNLGQLIGGIGASFMSNWISFVLFYIVFRRKSFEIVKNYQKILWSTVIIWIPIVVIYSIGALPEGSNAYLIHVASFSLYYYTRLVSIALNFILVGSIVYKNYRVRSKNKSRTPAEIAINTLCRRVIFYPILQTISRSGFAWYEFQYGFNFSIVDAKSHPDQYTALMYTAIITPTVSIGYLILFLTIEPHAYHQFKLIFCGINNINQDHNDRDSNFKIDESILSDTNDGSSMTSNIDPKMTVERHQSAYNRFSIDTFTTSVGNALRFSREADYDNRTEDEIFAVINECQSLHTEFNIDTPHSDRPSKNGINAMLTLNTMHVNSNNDKVLNGDSGL